jgi:hypothetical protein
MKIRSGFVSNSSSSSFIVKLKDLSALDLKHLLQFDSSDGICQNGYSDYWTITWNITDNEDVVRGYTNMDNGDLEKYIKEQNIDESIFTYEN